MHVLELLGPETTVLEAEEQEEQKEKYQEQEH
jgi:hypothetical protein